MKIGNPFDKPGLAPATANRGNPAEAANGGAESRPPTAAPSRCRPPPPRCSTAAPACRPPGAEFDAEKVDRIRREIEQGSYRVNPEAIADKLLANARELLGRPN